jgi:hypothetical protein
MVEVHSCAHAKPHAEPDAGADPVPDRIAHAFAHSSAFTGTDSFAFTGTDSFANSGADAVALPGTDACAHTGAFTGTDSFANSGADATLRRPHELLRGVVEFVQAVHGRLSCRPVPLWMWPRLTWNVHAVQLAEGARAPHNEWRTRERSELRGGVRRGLSRLWRRVPADHSQPDDIADAQPDKRTHEHADC